MQIAVRSKNHDSVFLETTALPANLLSGVSVKNDYMCGLIQLENVGLYSTPFTGSREKRMMRLYILKLTERVHLT